MWYKAHSTEQPDLVDISSSGKYNYIRRNVVLEESSGDGPDMFSYDEAKFEKDDTSIIGAMAEVMEESSQDAEYVNAEILLNQAQIIGTQSDQDEVLAEILLNQNTEG